MNLLRVRRLFAGEPVARFGTAGPGGRPHLMPVPFAVIEDGDDGVIVCDAAGQPRSLAGRTVLKDIAASPRVTFLVDGVSGAPGAAARSTTGPWWVHADAVAEILRPAASDPRWAMAAGALRERHPDGAAASGRGPLVWATVTRWSGWTARLDLAA